MPASQGQGQPQKSSEVGVGVGHNRSRSGHLAGPLSNSSASFRRSSFDSSGGRRKESESHLVAPSAKATLQLDLRNGDASSSSLSKWEAAVGNLEDARVAFDVLGKAVDDAVYLDEDAYNQVYPTSQLSKVIQAQHRKISQLEAQLRDLRLQLEESNSIQTEALQRHAEMHQELENNAVVFKMHYQELLAKDDEIQKLTAVIQALSTQ